MDQRLLLMHQAMLADRPRLRAYDAALEQAVEPGDVVVDVGAGTLALSMLALRHGADHVYAIEADPELVAVAERIIRSNDLKSRITLVQGDARVVRLPRRANVAVAELMGNLGPEENMMGVLGAVARRNLVDGGRIVPARLTTRLVPIEFDGEGWGIWGRDFFGYQLDAVRDFAQPHAQLHFFQREPRLLGVPLAVLDEVAGGRRIDGRGARHRLPITERGQLHAVVGYFAATLADGLTLANFPSYPGCNWAVWVWPVQHTPVKPGDEIRVALRSPSDGRASRVVTEWWLDCDIDRASGRP